MNNFKKAIYRFTANAAAIALSAAPAAAASEAVGPQYDSTHVYVAPSSLDAFVHAFVATFGGKPSAPLTVNVLPVPAKTKFQYVWTSAGTLSVFAFLTPIPYPFGQERTGWLVNDMDAALTAARHAGAEVIVDKFKDAIGYDAVIEWPGGLKTQLYWHFTAPSYPPLETIPDNRVYVSGDSVDTFVRDFLKFSGGTVVADDGKADAGEIGKPGEWYRRIRIESGFGRMLVMVTDGHLPYPFGREITGYAVTDLDATLAKAKAAGAHLLTPRFEAVDRSTIMLEFPGGYIAEVHALKAK